MKKKLLPKITHENLVSICETAWEKDAMSQANTIVRGYKRQGYDVAIYEAILARKQAVAAKD